MRPRGLVSMLVAALTLPPAAAAPWMRSEGEAAWDATLTVVSGDHYWDRQGDYRPLDCRSRNLYLSQGLEYGYSYYHTLFARADLASKRCGRDAASGLGDVELGIRGRLDLYRNGRTWELSVTLPTGYSRTAPSRLGYGRIGLEAGIYGLFKGSEADPVRSWDWEAGTSLRWWQGPPAEQWLGYLRWARRVKPLGKFTLGLDAELSFWNGTDEPTRFVNQSRQAEYDKLTARAAFSRALGEEWGWRVALGDVLWGRNASDDLSISFGIHRIWKP